ncbi:hypothetical protein [Streptomyces sp. NPDC012510]|uniref:hypothetical protein n=1 Tax=Streptomyces sp. NPDC012510 TaxID=3364838 RepID=UPI0036E52EDE
MIAFSLVALSYRSAAAALQTAFSGGGLFSEPGDLLRQWLLLGAWAGPAGSSLGEWLLYRAVDLLLLVEVWWALRLPTPTPVPQVTAGKPLTSITRKTTRHDAAAVAIGRRALGHPIRRRTTPPHSP